MSDLERQLADANARCADCGCGYDNHEGAGIRCTSHESCLGFTAAEAQALDREADRWMNRTRKALAERDAAREEASAAWVSYAAEQERSDAARAALNRVAALADEWEVTTYKSEGYQNSVDFYNGMDRCACELRAALATDAVPADDGGDR